MVDPRTNYKEALDEFLTCFICNSRFNTVTRRPLALFCGHTFCSSCVPHFKQVFNQLNCPIDHINEVRPATQVPSNEHLLGIVAAMEIKCMYHPDTPADYYSERNVEPLCEGCQPYFADQNCLEMSDLTFPDFILKEIEKLQGSPAVSGKLSRYPQLLQQLQNIRGLLNNDKQKVLASLQNLAAGREPTAQRQRPERPKPLVTTPTHWRKLDNNVYEIDRFRRIVPQTTQVGEETKQWWISNGGRQVDALVVWSSAPVYLVGVGLGREVSPTPASKIEFMDVLQGTSTQARALFRVFANTPYSGQNSQMMTVYFPQAVLLNAQTKITIKMKPVGRGLYYGDPSSRVEPLDGPNGLNFYFDDPAYESGDFQNGQSKWAGPIVKLYFSFPS